MGKGCDLVLHLQSTQLVQGNFALTVFRTCAESLRCSWIDRIESFDTLIAVVTLPWTGRLIRFKLG